MSSKQAGNAILIILIAVFLFGALAAAFMRGTRTGQTNLTAHQAKLQAQQLIDYSVALERTVQKLLTRGCSQNQLSFQKSPVFSAYTNPSAPPDMTCHVFESAGGGLSAPITIDNATYSITYSTRVQGLGCDAASGNCAELIFFVENIGLNTCMAINTSLRKSTDEAAIRDNISTTPYVGTLSAAPVMIGDAPANASDDLQRQDGMCMKRFNAPEDYIFYKVLIVQ